MNLITAIIKSHRKRTENGVRVAGEYLKLEAERDQLREDLRNMYESISEAEDALEDMGFPEGQRFSKSVLKLGEEIKNLKAMLEADCEHMVDLETIKKVLRGYLSIIEDCCKGEKACLRCQHRDWFKTFIEGAADEKIGEILGREGE